MDKQKLKARALKSDKLKRWTAGEIGDVLDNDYPQKYDYQIQFPGKVRVPNLLGSRDFEMARVYYFYANEIELI